MCSPQPDGYDMDLDELFATGRDYLLHGLEPVDHRMPGGRSR
jgi:hypothetical protein